MVELPCSRGGESTTSVILFLNHGDLPRARDPVATQQGENPRKPAHDGTCPVTESPVRTHLRWYSPTTWLDPKGDVHALLRGTSEQVVAAEDCTGSKINLCFTASIDTK